jgi:signal transduction histidine kinase
LAPREDRSSTPSIAPEPRTTQDQIHGDDLLQERASIGGIVFALIMLSNNWGNTLRFWLAGAICTAFAVFATKLSQISFMAGDRDNANLLHIAGNTLFGLGIMAVSDFAPSSLFVMPVAVLLFEGFSDGETRPFSMGMLAILAVIALCAGAAVVPTLAAATCGLVAHWLSGARSAQLRSLRSDLKSAAYLLRQANEKLRHANDMVDVRNTELRTTQERLNAAQGKLAQSEQLASVGQLAAGVAKELSDPLSTILGFARDMDKRIGQDEGVRAIIRDSMRCRALTQELITFSESSKTAVQRIDVNALLRGAVHRLEAKARAQGTSLKMELSPDAPALVGNVAQLQQLVVDLATSMLGTLTDRNHLTLRSQRSWDGNVSIEIQDDGAGKHAGVASSATHEVARQHGGLIDVRRSAGQGTTAVLTFPARSRASVA